MSWFGGGLSNIQGKLTSFTAQVLNDVVETVQGSGDSDSNEETNGTNVTLEASVALKTQHDYLVKKNHELEAQVGTLSRSYRNLLSSLKRESNAVEPGNEAANAGGSENVTQGSCWNDLEQWLKSHGLVLPQSLNDQIIENLRSGTTIKPDLSNYEDQHKKCKFFEERIASLEEELESLDQQHQSALEVALTTRDQLKEENRLLNLRIVQLESEAHKILDAQTNQIEKIKEERGLSSRVPQSHEFTTHETEEPKAISVEIQETHKEIEKYKDSVSCLTAKLNTLERVQQENDALHSQLNQLSATISELALTHKTVETRLTEENVELQTKVTILTNQNEILSSMTSVLDRITEENRVLETNLETVASELKAKVIEVNKLRDEIITGSASLKEEKSTETETSLHELKPRAEDQSNSEINKERESADSRVQQLLEENVFLKNKLTELEKIHEDCQHYKLSLDQMTKSFNNLKTELVSTQEALRTAELRAENFADGHLKFVQKLEDLEMASKTSSDGEASESASKENDNHNEIANLKEENDALQRKIEMLESTQSDIHSLADIRLGLEIELSQAQEEVQCLKINCSELEATNAKIETEFNALQSDLLLLNQTTLSLKLELDTNEAEKILLREQLNALQCQLLEKACQSVSREDATTEVNFYRDEMNNMSQEIAELKSRIKQVSEERTRVEEHAELEKRSHFEEVGNVNAALKRADLQIEENQREREMLINELEAIREELHNTRTQSEELAVKTDQHAKEVDRLNSEVLKLQEALVEAEESSAELVAKNRELHGLHVSQTEALDELKHTLATVRQKYDLLVEEKQSSSDKESQALTLELGQKQQEIASLLENVETLKSERDQFLTQFKENSNERDLLRETLQAFQQQREQLVETVQQKHQEAVNYHTETLRLAKICEDLQVNLNEKAKLEEEIHQLQTENDVIKANQGQWQAEMERLRTHLLNVEETYTQELLNSQAKEKALRDSLQAAEERASEQSRANDQLAGWPEKYRKSLAEKDKLEKEKMDQERSLERLQHALQQLTREKERDIVLAQKELLLKLAKAESVHSEKAAEIVALRRKLGEAQQGLEAASRLTQQLDKTKEALATAKEQALNQEKELSKVRQQIEKLQSGTDTKVDKSLVKNLLIGYIAAPSAKQKHEVLRIVATVMEFSPEDRQKTGIEDSTGGLAGWASGILKSRTWTSSGNSSVGDVDKSLSEAFISFLESESARPNTPRLPVQQPGENFPGAKATTSMTTFQPGRNEPTILRDILRDSES